MHKRTLAILAALALLAATCVPAFANEEWCSDDPVIFGHHITVIAPKALEPWVTSIVIGG